MALFFHSFRNCGTSDGLGIPVFPLSRNELKARANKYEDDEVTLSDEDDEDEREGEEEDGRSEGSGGSGSHSGPRDDPRPDRFQRLDLNRLRRSGALLAGPPRRLSVPARAEEDARTQVRSNLSSTIAPASPRPSPSARRPFSKTTTPPPPRYRRTRSDVDEVTLCLRRAASHREFGMADFHRAPSGELEPRRFKSGGGNNSNNDSRAAAAANTPGFHRSALVRKVSAPMVPDDRCRSNLGKVHYQLAVLHGRGRFPEAVPRRREGGAGGEDEDDDEQDLPEHDAPSVLFHLSHAASLLNAPACLSLARVLSGRTSCVSDLLPSIVPVDFDLAKELLERAMTTLTLVRGGGAAAASAYRESVAPKVAAGCLLVVLLLEEREQKRRELNEEPPAEKNPPPYDHHFRRVLSETLDLYEQYRDEVRQLDAHYRVMNRPGTATSSSDLFSGGAEPSAAVPFHVGDRVEANYALEGTYYPAAVTRVAESSEGDAAADSVLITVQYDDDGSSEDLPVHQVRHWIPPTATQTRSGGPLLLGADVSGGAAFGSIEDDADCELLLKCCEVQALLAEATELEASEAAAVAGAPLREAAALYELAAEGAAEEGMMSKATAWSLKSADLIALASSGAPP
jgi:elongation factor 2 kinase